MRPPPPGHPLGRHLLVELYGCLPERLDDPALLVAALRDAAEAIGAKVVGEARHRYLPQGASAVLLVAESHLSLHTWPEARYAAADVFTCAPDAPLYRAPALLAARLGAARQEVHELVRGAGWATP